PAPARPGLSLHDALPIFLDIPGAANPVLANDDSDVPSVGVIERVSEPNGEIEKEQTAAAPDEQANTTAFSFEQHTLDLPQAYDEDRKSTRLNSSHVKISY